MTGAVRGLLLKLSISNTLSVSSKSTNIQPLPLSRFEAVIREPYSEVFRFTSPIFQVRFLRFGHEQYCENRVRAYIINYGRFVGKSFLISISPALRLLIFPPDIVVNRIFAGAGHSHHVGRACNVERRGLLRCGI